MSQKIDHTFLTSLDNTPPFLVRHFAVTDYRTLKSISRISRESGISRRQVQRIIAKNTWKNIKAGMISKFMAACGYNPFSDLSRDRIALMADKNFPHLTKLQRSKLFEKMGWKQ